MIQIKHTLSIQEDGVTISGRITDCIFSEGSERGDCKEIKSKDWEFHIFSAYGSQLQKKAIFVWGNENKKDNDIISYTYSSPEEAQKIMSYINEFTIKN